MARRGGRTGARRRGCAQLRPPGDEPFKTG